jgi:site-specific DNA recombinase
MQNIRKIALYCRVSTSSQEKQETIETQLSKLREVYKNEKIVKEYIDVCSGFYLEREGLNQLRKDAKNGLFNVVAVYSLDRLSRKLAHQIALIEELEKCGVKVESLFEGDVDSTPEGILNRNIRGAFSEYERYKIAQRMRDGKYRKAAEGDFVWGTPPYGYTIVKKGGKRKLAINPKEAEVVKAIFKIYLEEFSLYKTAKRIYEMGYRARTKRNGKNIPFSPFMISKILDNEVYIGNFYYGKTFPSEPENPRKEKRKYTLSSRKYRPKEEWKMVKVPAIIDKATFERVQEIKKEMAKHSLKPTRHYLCQGLLRCIHCGYRYIGKMRSKSHREESPHGVHFYYVCPNKASRRRPGQPLCHSREINTRTLDTIVWEFVSSLIKDKEKLRKAIKNLIVERENKREINQKKYENLVQKKLEIKRKKSKLLDLYGDGNISKEDLDEKILELNSQQEELEKQIKEVEKELLKVDEIEMIEKEIEQACSEYMDKIDNADFELKRRILKKWVKEINLPDEGGILIKVRIPPPEKPIKIQFSQGEKVVQTQNTISEEV